MSTENKSCLVYNKRAGTSGIRGQLYESKLISLIYYRMKHDDRVEEFHLVSNVDKIGIFDDISFIVKLKGFDKPLAVFIQAKHKENDSRMLQNDLAKCFESYLKIKQIFKPNSGFVFSKSKFEETECFFILYTTAKDDFGDVLVESSFASVLDDLVGTGGTAKQPYKNEEDVDFLCKSMKEEIIALAGPIAKLIYYDNDNFQLILNNELVLRYNVILAQKVFHVSEIQSERHRIASFRQDFFSSNEEFLILFKDTLYSEVLKNRKLGDTDIQALLSKLLEEPCNVKTLSELIGTVIRYNNGQLEFLNKISIEADFKRRLNKVSVSQATIDQAIELAAKEILLSRKFKVPTAFGNKDLTLNGTVVQVENKLNKLALKVFDLLENSKSSNNIVTIDDSLDNALLQPNGGIAGAVGNILVADENKKLMKFTDNCELLGHLAKELFEKLRNGIYNLQEYKFCIKIKKFPKLSLARREYEENLAKDFLDKLLFYSSQADENEVEEILKTEIEEGQHNQLNNFQIRTDALCINFHDKIQKWWMKPKQAEYLTKDATIYEDAMTNIIKAPLMSVVNMMYKMKHIYYTFNEDALRSQKLQYQHSRTVIITESSALTVTKVAQCMQNKEHVVLDLEYILNLPTNDRNALRSELTKTDEEKILIFVCDKIQNSKYVHKTLENFAKAVLNKKIIVITNQILVDIINKYFEHPDNVIYDKNNNLSDMSKESQENILKNARVNFQGKEVGLDLILDEESLACVEREVLNKITNMETVVVGKDIGNFNYDEMKHLYVDRRIKKTEDDIGIVIESLHDLLDDVVIVTATPGMGKSTLLSHLSVKTKELDPKRWIVRIHLLEYSGELNTWSENETIDSLDTVNFMCQVILREKFGKENRVKFVLEEENGDVYLKDYTGDQETEFEFKLFLHFYNRENLIILLDGFDEICPQYTNEVIKFLKTISNHPQKHRIWVTSRPYNEVKSILEAEFGTSYEIEPFSHEEIQKYLEKFWKYNFILKEFDSKQLENVHDFIEFMSDSENFRLQTFAFSLRYTYFNAGYYLINEIKYTHLPLWTYYSDTSNQIVNNNFFTNYDKYFKKHKLDEANNPLLLYLAADYFQNEIKDTYKKNNKWNTDIKTYTFYERFIETKLEKIRFQDKNKMDIYKPDVMRSYKKDRAEFFAMHKKLGAYAIFHNHSNMFFNTKELTDIKDTIKLIEKGGEKTGLIYSVAYDIPIFEHMTFAEYFAVEYMCDLIKSESCSENQKSWMEFIFKVIFTTYNFLNVHKMIGYKMQIDKALMSVLDQNKIIIFKMLMEQGKAHAKYCRELREMERMASEENMDLEEMVLEVSPLWTLFNAIWLQLHDYITFFVSIFESFIDETNAHDFLEYVFQSALLSTLQSHGFDVLVIFVLNIIKKYDNSKLNTVVRNNYPFLPCSTNYDTMTSEEIVDLVHSYPIKFPRRFPAQASITEKI